MAESYDAFTPKDEDLKRIAEMRTRAEEKALDSRDEAKQNKNLVDGDIDEWEQLNIVPSLTGKNTIVIRNSLGQNVRDDADRMMPSDPRWEAEALVPVVYVPFTDPMTGKVSELEVDNVERTAKFKQVSNFVSHATRQAEEAHRVLLDTGVSDNGYMLVGPPDGFDVSSTAGFPTAVEDEPGLANVGKKIMRGKVLHSGVKPYLPVFLREPGSNILLDPDADTMRQVNCLYRYVCRPLVDVKKDKRYKNTKDLKANVTWDGLRFVAKADKADKATPSGNEYLGFWEYHYRTGSKNPDETRDGYEYFILTYVEQSASGDSGNPDTPVCIRHVRYPIDLGGFAIKRVQLTPINDDLYGYAANMRYARRAAAVESMALSMGIDWLTKNKTRRVWNKAAVTPEQIEAFNEADSLDDVLLDLKAPDTDIRKIVTEVPASQIPPEIMPFISILRGLADESYGRSANQRGQVEGRGPATEVQIVANETNAKIKAMNSRFRRFMEDVQTAGMIIFSELLPEHAPGGKKWVIPNTDKRGEFVSFTATELACYATLSLDYSSMQSADDEVMKKQATDFIAVLSKLNPDQLRLFKPMILRLALGFGVDWETQVRKVYDILDKGSEPTADPKMELILMLQGELVEPDPTEDFTQTIPMHRAQLANAGMLEGPQAQIWQTPMMVTLDGKPMGKVATPLDLLSMHIDSSLEMAAAKGITIEGMSNKEGRPAGPEAGGMPGEMAGQAEQGSGPESLRQGQGVPSAGDVGASVQASASPGRAGMGRI